MPLRNLPSWVLEHSREVEPSPPQEEPHRLLPFLEKFRSQFRRILRAGLVATTFGAAVSSFSHSLPFSPLEHPHHRRGGAAKQDLPTSLPEERVRKMEVPEGAIEPGRFELPPGYTIELVAHPELTGSVINLALDAKGRPVISREGADKGLPSAVLLLEDEDANGTYETALEYTREVQDCQGILPYDRKTLYLVGRGPQGFGLYRLRDEDEDDQPDQGELIHPYRTGDPPGEHCPHAVILGPDGSLYVCLGNHAALERKPPPESPVSVQEDGNVLPLIAVGGAMSGGHSQGGTIWRLDPQGQRYSLETVGLRNHYDLACNSAGELLTFDSDMEWDIGLPWYRPIRVCHTVPGADFGWRPWSGTLPAATTETLPPIIDLGRGSPTGMIFYEHRQFRRKYGALFLGDWSRGRVLAMELERSGATYRGGVEEFVRGTAFSVTDLDVTPDGSLLVSTGGRGTGGGIYRIRSSAFQGQEEGRGDPPEGPSAVHAALQQPQPLSAWGREALRHYHDAAGASWGPELSKAVIDPSLPEEQRLRALSLLALFGPEPTPPLLHSILGGEGEELRAFATSFLPHHPATAVEGDLLALLQDPSPLVLRRALEGCLRLQLSPSLPLLRPLLAHPDRVLRYLARLVLERSDPSSWEQEVLQDPDPRVAIIGLIALPRIGDFANHPERSREVGKKLQELFHSSLPPEDLRDTVRALQLFLIHTSPPERGEVVMEGIGRELLRLFPTGEEACDHELARTIAAMEVSGGIEELLIALEGSGSKTEEERAHALHYADCLSRIQRGWTLEQRLRFLHFFDSIQSWQGDRNFPLFLQEIYLTALRGVGEEERIDILAQDHSCPRAAQDLLLGIKDLEGFILFRGVGEQSNPRLIPVLQRLLKGEGRGIPRSVILEALGRVKSPEAEAVLQSIYEHSPEDRDAIVRELSRTPSPKYWRMFFDALESGDLRTRNAAIKALKALPSLSESEKQRLREAQRSQGGEGPLRPLPLRWGYRTPRRPSVESREKGREGQKWDVAELAAFLEEDRRGDPQRGKGVYEKARCASCHRLGILGRGYGPDLTFVTSRFNREEILRAILKPSETISDQYRSITVFLRDGRIVTGQRAGSDQKEQLLIPADGTPLRLPLGEVEEVQENTQSLMPEGLLDTLTREEIADLFALLFSPPKGH
jgi:putative heme-binding domain-containing protein